MIYGIVLGAILFPGLGDMSIPVMIYLCIIVFMGICAAAGGHNHHYAITGAALFIFSDSLIAINKFMTQIPFHNLFIMTAYYSGQWFIANGMYRTYPNLGHDPEPESDK